MKFCSLTEVSLRSHSCNYFFPLSRTCKVETVIYRIASELRDVANLEQRRNGSKGPTSLMR